MARLYGIDVFRTLGLLPVARHQILKRERIEYILHGLFHFFPDVSGDTVFGSGTYVGVVNTLDGSERTLEDVYDSTEGYVSRRLAEGQSTPGTAHTADEPGLYQGSYEVFEILGRNSLSAGNIAKKNRTTV